MGVVVRRYVLYSGKLSGKKTFEFFPVQNKNFAEKTFADCSDPIIMWVRPQKIAEKTFTDGSDTAKNTKVFSLESFLYTVDFLILLIPNPLALRSSVLQQHIPIYFFVHF